MNHKPTRQMRANVVTIVSLAATLLEVSGCASPASSGDEMSSTGETTNTTTNGTTGAESTHTSSTSTTTAATATASSNTSTQSTTAATTSTSVASSAASSTSVTSSGANSSLDTGTAETETSSEAASASSDVETGSSSVGSDAQSSSDDTSEAVDLETYAEGFAELMIHDACTAPNPESPDTCLHEQEHEESFVFGGETGEVYDVELRIRGLFEPTNITGGTTPYPEFPYFKVGGTVNAADYSQWHIVVSDPEATYWLNHYPSTGHTIYKQDFTCVIPIAAGADVSVRVVDGNNRMIDNGATGLADRQQTIEGVTDGVLDGQVLRIDVEGVALR